MERLLTLEENFDSMDKRLTEMEEKIDSIDTKLTQVVDAILGNPLTGKGGFMAEIEELRKEIAILKEKQSKYDTFKNRILWTIGIILGASTVVGLTLKALIELYITVQSAK